MNFTNVLFLPFLVATFLAWLPFKNTGRKIVLVTASALFYSAWDIRFLGILIFVWLVILIVPPRIQRAAEPASRRWTVAGVVVLVLVLFVFKYFNFFIDSFLSVLSSSSSSGFHNSLSLILPIGISFYTFLSISYLLDVRSGKVEASVSWLDTALYVSFFPLVLAGPIEKGSHWMPQVTTYHPFRLENIRDGFERMLLGYLLKVAIADPLVPLCDDVFNRYATAGSGELLAGGIGYSMLILADFSGYSLIARGAAKIFGYEIIKNFEQPYFSRSFSEFWRRWHISLSTWIWEYVFYPLMSRVLKLLHPLHFRSTKTDMGIAYSISVLFTMLLCGLWHGAGYTYVIWGGLHGLFLMFERLLIYGNKSIPKRKRIRNLYGLLRAGLSWIIVFSLVTFAWIIFRSPDVSVAKEYLSRIFTAGGWTMPIKLVTRVAIAAAALAVLESLAYWKRNEWIFRTNGHSRWPLYVLAFIFIIAFGGFGGDAPFIYLQF